MPKYPRKLSAYLAVEGFTFPEARRRNVPTAEYRAMLAANAPARVACERRNSNLNSQLIWRRTDEQDAEDLVVNATPSCIQQKKHPKALADDLPRPRREEKHDRVELTADLFSDFNGIAADSDKTEYNLHDQNWTNRMILVDSLKVLAR